MFIVVIWLSLYSSFFFRFSFLDISLQELQLVKNIDFSLCIVALHVKICYLLM